MMRFIKSVMVTLFAGSMALGMASQSAKATPTAIYSYTGNTFTSITDEEFVTGTYTTADRVSGTFTLSTPLAPNTPLTTILGPSLISFSFSDGRNTISDTTPELTIVSFDIGTDTAGGVNTWNILLRALTEDVSGNTLFPNIRTTSSPDLVLDFGQIAPPFGNRRGNTDEGVIRDNPGTWNLTLVPEPSALLLFAAGLAGLAGFGRRRRRGA